jgi:hypothetical protein
MSGAGEPGGEAIELRGFAGAVEALEGDEGTAWHGVSVPHGVGAHPS